jgi:hypothetical protein
MDLVYYNAILASHARNHRLSGIEKFSSYFKIYNMGVVPIDRTGTITFPIKTKSLFPMPEFRTFAKTYEQICNERAKELLARAEKADVTLYSFWSGGIDSTTVLVSFLKNATDAQRERIVVLMSEESISENPNFYRDHVHGKLRRDSSAMFPYLIGSKHLLVNGEHNDQLFGSDIVASVIGRFGAEVLHRPYDRNTFLTFFTEKIDDPNTASFYVGLFERLKEAAPIDVKTNYDLFWWINFAVKWQTVYTRMLSYTAKRNTGNINEEYLRTNYAPFFNTEDFQLWSMNNPDKKIKDEWRTYKWPAKEVIYGYTKDAEYRDNKTKRGSLYHLILQQIPSNFIDDKLRFYDALEPELYHQPNNDFT